MGNCLAKQHQQHIRVEDELKSPTKFKNVKPSPRDATDSTESDSNGDVDNTFALSVSPESALQPSLQRVDEAAVSPAFTAVTSPVTQTKLLYSSSLKELEEEISPLRSFPSGEGTHQKPAGRALRARLEKSRHVQQTLDRKDENHSSAAAFDDNSALEIREAASSSSLLYRYSLVDHDGGVEAEAASGEADATSTTTSNTNMSMMSSEKLNQQFDAAASRGTIWAQFNCEKACAVALSRQQPTLKCTAPLLFLAVGSAEGLVTVTELLDDSSPSFYTGFDLTAEQEQQQQDRRLGNSLRLECDGRIRSLDFSPDGQYLAIGDDDCFCTVVKLEYEETMSGTGAANVPKLKNLRVIAEFERVDRVCSVKFSPNGRYLAMGGFDGAVAIAGTSDISESFTPELVAEIASEGLIFSLDWSPDAKYLAFGGSDRICSIVDVSSSWNVVHEIRRPAQINSIKWNPSTSRFLAIGSSDVAIIDTTRDFSIYREIEVAHAKSSRKRLSRVNGLCWSPNGSYVVVSDSSSTCKVIETKTFVTVQEITRSSNINAIVWGEQAPLGGVPRRYLVVGDNESVAIIKAGVEMNGTGSASDDLSSSFSSASFFSYRGNDSSQVGEEWVLKENAFRDIDETMVATESGSMDRSDAIEVLAVCFSRGSKSRPSSFVAYATGDGLVTVKMVSTWQTRAQLRFPKPATSLLFSNGSRYLVIGCEDSTVYVASTTSSWPLIAKAELTSPVKTVIFSKDNNFIGAGTSDGSFVLLDSSVDYNISGSIDDGDSPVSATDWCSRTLAIGREDGSVRLFDTGQVSTGYYVPIAELTRRGTIRSVAFGLRGRFLAVGTSDGLVGIYSSKGGWVLSHQLKCSSGVNSLRWNPNGRFLAVTDDDGSLRVLDTVLWADVREASGLFEAESGSTGASSANSLAVSQNGKLLAVARGRKGLSVVDTNSWDVIFSSASKGSDVPDSASSSSAAVDDISVQ